MSTIKVKFLIDREQKRVVFAEAGSDFVDLLFSFLMLPLGRIARLLSKQSGLESLSSLYRSVEQLDVKYLQTEACRDMLLNPRSAAAEQLEALKIKGIHELNPMRIYICSQRDCETESICYYTYASKGLCSHCGKLMDRAVQLPKSTTGGGVFVIDAAEFIITDDLHITLSSSRMGLSLFKQLQIKDSSVLEEKIIEFGVEEALKLLGRSLASKNALTEVFFPDFTVQISGDFSLSYKEDFIAEEAKNEINLELIMNKKDNKILYAEVGDDFVNQLFSFLTFPLGSALNFLSDTTFSLDGCIQNLYSSVGSMSSDCFKLEIYRNMLLTPALPAFYGIKNQILKLEEMSSTKFGPFRRCFECFSYDEGLFTSCECMLELIETEYIEENPKSSKKIGDITDGGFVVSTTRSRFMVTDNLHISPLSLISAACKGTNIPISDLIRREVCLDRTKVMSLLIIMLSSKATLTDVFSRKPKRQWRSQNNYA